MFKTTNMFIWFSNGKYIQDSHGQILLEEKPIFSFEYQSLKYYWNEAVYSVSDGGEEIELTQSQKEEIENFIQTHRTKVGILGFCVDKDGKFLGRKRIDSQDVCEIVSVTPPTQDDWIWNFTEQTWKRVYYYTQNGTYTHSTDTNAIGFTYEPKPIDNLEYKLDIETHTWLIDETPETISLHKKNCLDDLVIKYIEFLLTQNVEHDKIINNLALIQTDTFANDMISNSIDELMNANTLTDINETYEIAKQISLTLKK